jgi:two-component system sensor histidine kinase CiaH
MFKKLRNKFLVINLVTISVMMLIAFSSIYLITYNNVHRDIDMELHKISEFNQKSKEIPKDPKPNFDKDKSPQDRSLSFNLITDKEGTIISSFSIFDMEEKFYEEAKKIALSKNGATGEFKLDGNHWAYIRDSYEDGHRIVFLDVTSAQGILTSLIYTFLAVALIMLIFIFFISKFFANKAIEPIKNVFDKQKQFIADASHELKTPLAVINTNVDVLLTNGEDNINDGSKWLYYIKSEVERMTKLTNDLLYLTQIDYSDINIIFSEFDLSEAVENVILTMEAVIYENNISLQYDIEANIKVYGNIEQIKQVVMILLDNALKYTNHKGSVNVTLKKYQSNILFSVINTGIGIPVECTDEIFDRFYRIDKSRARNKGGYGLGLAIAKAIVEQHKGRIAVKSVEDESTTFTVELPS